MVSRADIFGIIVATTVRSKMDGPRLSRCLNSLSLSHCIEFIGDNETGSKLCARHWAIAVMRRLALRASGRLHRWKIVGKTRHTTRAFPPRSFGSEWNSENRRRREEHPMSRRSRQQDFGNNWPAGTLITGLHVSRDDFFRFGTATANLTGAD